MKKYRIIIAGGRDFTDYDYLCQSVETVLEKLDVDKSEIEIVSGTAKGADTLGERYASENGIQVSRFIPNWNVFGRRAGFIRNHQMGDYANVLVAFWDGESHGTKDMIEYSKEKDLDVNVFFYNTKVEPLFTEK